MQRFKRIILPMQGHGKSDLHWLYNTKSEYESPLIFSYEQLRFWFSGTSYRTSEKLLLYVAFPAKLLEMACAVSPVATETYLLGLLSPTLNELSESYQWDALEDFNRAELETYLLTYRRQQEIRDFMATLQPSM